MPMMSYWTTVLFWFLAGVVPCLGSPSRSSHVTTIGLCPCNESDASFIVHVETPPLADILKKSEELSRELAIDRTRVSAKLRQKSSAPDQRLSSKSMGAVGGMVILVVVGSVVIMDLITMNAKRSKKRNGSKNRKISNTSSLSSSVSADMITHSDILAQGPTRRFSSASTSIANSFHIGFNDLNISLSNNNNFIQNILPVSLNTKSAIGMDTKNVNTSSKSFTSTTNEMACSCQLAASSCHSRSRSFSCLRQTSETEIGISVLSLRSKKEPQEPQMTRTCDAVPDIIITCGESK